MADLPSGAITFLFTDIEGSTRLLKQFRERYGEVLAEHQALLRAAFVAHGGHEIDTQGDSFFVAFTSAREALLAAVEGQRALLSHPWPAGSQVRVRMGLHTGQAVATDVRYTGLGVHRAARICATGHGGQVLVSQATQTLLEDEEEDLGVFLRDLGEQRLKDLERPVRLYQADADGLLISFPPLRQTGELAQAAEAAVTAPGPLYRRPRFVALAALVLAVAAAAFGTAILVGSRGPSAGALPRVALVIPRPPVAGEADTFVTPLVDGLRRAEREYGVRTEMIVMDENDPDHPSVAKAAARLRDGAFDLVLVSSAAEFLLPTAKALESTPLVLLNVSREEAGVQVPNATGLVFADDQAGYLAGYLSGLVEARQGPRLNARRIVSVIGAAPAFPPVARLVSGFSRGVRRSLPGVTVLTDYSKDFVDQAKCETIANQQIDDGSDLVFAVAGTCSFGALRAAAIRRVWGIGVDGDRSYLGDHILASTVHATDEAVLLAVRWFVQGTLPAGQDVVMGLETSAVGIVGINAEVPPSVRREVARAAAALTKGSEP